MLDLTRSQVDPNGSSARTGDPPYHGDRLDHRREQRDRPRNRQVRVGGWDRGGSRSPVLGRGGSQPPVLADPNRRVRSRFTPPKRKKFETRAGSAPRNVLNFLTSHNLTKMAVVQLCQRNWPERGPNWPETGRSTRTGGSEISPRMPKFCAVPAVGRASKKNVQTGRVGGARGTVVEHSQCAGETGRW
jgi:hypothetical protein